MIDYSSPAFHKGLINDRFRSLAYQQALRSVIRPGDTVLDIGAGSGVLSLFACQAGASQVYAVERTGMARVARTLAAANGFASRISVLEQDIFEIELPDRVDVIVSELICQGLIGQNMEAITEYARKKLLKPNGRIIPETVDYFMTPVACEKARSRLSQPEPDLYGLNFLPIRELFLNASHPVRLADCQQLAPPQPAYRIDSMNVVKSQRPQVKGHFKMNSAAQCDGLAVWFDSRLAPGVQIDSRGSCDSWGAVLFPLHLPCLVAPDTEVTFSLEAKQLSNGDCVYQWASNFSALNREGVRQQMHASQQSTLSNFTRQHHQSRRE